MKSLARETELSWPSALAAASSSSRISKFDTYIAIENRRTRSGHKTCRRKKAVALLTWAFCMREERSVPVCSDALRVVTSLDRTWNRSAEKKVLNGSCTVHPHFQNPPPKTQNRALSNCEYILNKQQTRDTDIHTVAIKINGRVGQAGVCSCVESRVAACRCVSRCEDEEPRSVRDKISRRVVWRVDV